MPKREHPFGFPQTPFDPRTGKFLAFGGDDEAAGAAAAGAAAAVVIEEFGDYLSTSIGRVSKPWLLRQTPFDGVAFGGVTYEYTEVGARTATDAEDEDVTETQQITPSYVVGEQLLTLGGVDLNTAGRCWAAVEEE